MIEEGLHDNNISDLKYISAFVNISSITLQRFMLDF